jgi:hypothetical protein
MLKHRMRVLERHDAQARVPKGQAGGGQFTSGGSGGGGVRRTPEERQAKAIAYLQQSAAKRVARSAAAKERASQQLLFKRAPKKTAPEGGYTLNKAFQGASGAKAVAGIKNKAMVHEKGEIALAEHKARKARTGRTVPPSAAAPSAGAPQTPARLTPDITIRGRMPTKGEYAQHLEILKDAAAGKASKHLAGEMSDEQHAAWGALHQHGLMHQPAAGGAHQITPKGREYLSQRSAAAAPAAPASPIMSQSKGEHAAAVERIKNSPRIHGDKTERQLEQELQRTTASEGHAAQAVERMRTRVQVAEKAGHIDDEMDRRKRLADETESHATATTRRKEVESEIAHRATQATAPAKTAPARPLSGVSNHDLESAQNQHISTLTQMSHDVSVRARRAGQSAADFEHDIADPSHPQHAVHQRYQAAKENVRSHVAETEDRRETRERETEATAARERGERAAGLTERKYARPIERALTKGERDTNKQIDQHDREVERLASSMDKLKDPARRRDVNAQIDRVHRERERLELSLAPGVRNAHETNQAVAQRAKLAKAAEKRRARDA